MQSLIMNSHEVFIHIHQGCFAGTGAIVRLPQCQWSKPDGYGKISQCITTTKHSKAKTVCIFLGIYTVSRYISITRFRRPYWLNISLFHTPTGSVHGTWNSLNKYHVKIEFYSASLNIRSTTVCCEFSPTICNSVFFSTKMCQKSLNVTVKGNWK